MNSSTKLILTLVVLGAAGAAGYYLWKKNKASQQTVVGTTSANPNSSNLSTNINAATGALNSVTGALNSFGIGSA